MQTFFGSNRTLTRYLTLFYGITLGLAFVLAFFSIYNHENVTPSTVTATATQPVLAQTVSPTPGVLQGHTRDTPTSLPAIPSTPNEKTPSPLGVAATELHGLQVTVWHPWTGGVDIALQEILDEFNRSNPWGITVQTSAYEGFGKLDDAVESAFVSGSLPDVLVDYGYQAQNWDGKGVVTDQMPYVNDPVWGLTGDEQADFYPGFWAEDTVTAPGSSQRSIGGVDSVVGSRRTAGDGRHLGGEGEDGGKHH